MKPLRFRMNLIVATIGVVAIFLCYISYTTFHKIQFYEKNIHASVEANILFDKIINKKSDATTTKKMQSMSKDMYPARRQNQWDNIVKDYSNENKSALARHINNFQKDEGVYYVGFKNQISYLEKKLYFYSVALFSSMLLLLIGFNFYMTSEIFMPLKTVTQRMTDFLNGKYSYFFGTPEENEMGELQSAFNSMAQEVLSNMEELKALDNAKSDFLNIASHELRTPMTSIKGSLSLISSGVMGNYDEDALNLIKIAEMETDRLIRLINDILDMAKIDARKLPLKLSWVSLHEIIDKTVMSLQGLAQTFDVEIQKENFDDIDVYCDADRIQQVITNLASNAIKFSPQKNKVEIIVSSDDGGAIKVMVRDHGKGMTPQEKSILFQKFRQISSPENPIVKGTGLGLAIAKALVEEHQGKIDVQTKPNEGSTFFFTLPQWRYQIKAA